MTSRPAAPDSETPEVDALLLEYKDVPFEDEWKCAFAMYDLARSLERRLSLAQTEIKGHMRVEDELKTDYVRAREFIEQQSERIAELEKVLVSLLAFPFELDKLERGSREWAAAMAAHTEVLEAAQILVGAAGSLKSRA